MILVISRYHNYVSNLKNIPSNGVLSRNLNFSTHTCILGIGGSREEGRQGRVPHPSRSNFILISCSFRGKRTQIVLMDNSP